MKSSSKTIAARRLDEVVSKREQGTAIVLVVISLGALVAIAAWASETSRMWQAKSQLQTVADSAALAGVGSLLINNFQTADPIAAQDEAASYAPLYDILGTPLAIPASDIETGSWDLDTRAFTSMPGSTDAAQVRAVRVRARRDATSNGGIPTILGAAIGVASVNVNAEAVAYWGYAGSGGPGVADLPIVIDCCAVSGNSPGSACTQNYCETITNGIPNACPLDAGGTASCLEFHSQPDQNACWTVFDGGSPSINTPDLLNNVSDGNTVEIDGPIYLDNGDKVPVISEIKDRFEGTGNYDPAEGTDTNGDGTVDSWVVTLPVVECQQPGDGCGSGNSANVVGFICFDIHEVESTPGKIIRGTFLCSTDPRCDTDGLGPGGTIPGAISAQYPVLVD